MARLDEMKKIFDSFDETTRKIVDPLLEELDFIETRLSELRTLPHISVNPMNPAQQRATPAAKQYKELVQQEANLLKLLLIAARREGGEGETSPLREYLNRLKKGES